MVKIRPRIFFVSALKTCSGSVTYRGPGVGADMMAVAATAHFSLENSLKE